MRIGAVLERAIESRDQRDLVSHLFKRSQRRCQCQRMSARWDGLAFESPDIVLACELGQGTVQFTWEEASSRDSVWQVEERQSLRGSLWF